MPSCVVRHCKNYYAKVNKIQGISYHSFPKNKVIFKEWVRIIRTQRSEFDWKPSKSSTICSDHFKKKDKYLSTKGQTHIRKTAIPYIKKSFDRSIDNVFSNISTHRESPKKAALKKMVNSLNFEKKILRKKNKTLVQQNKRLKKKISSILMKINEIGDKEHIYVIY